MTVGVEILLGGLIGILLQRWHASTSAALDAREAAIARREREAAASRPRPSRLIRGPLP